MFKDKSRIKGKLTITVFDENGNIKRYDPNWIQKFLGLPGKLMQVVNHNIVTDEGDALVADLMAKTPVKTKVDGTNGRIVVGTGWTGTTPKANTWVNTGTGSAKLLTSPYPQLKGSFGAANDNVIQYRTTFAAGDLNATGINEACLTNGTADVSAECLAYAQITPSVNVASTDTLQVDWEITFTGA
jgi:hypothetical protein